MKITMVFRDKTTVLRDKARGPLGWILGVVGGLALLVGSFFAGVATADTSGDQEQASVTEQEVQREQDTDKQGAEDQDAEDRSAEDQDTRSESRPRLDDEDADADANAEADGEAETEADTDGDGRPHKHHHRGDDGIPGDGDEPGNGPAEDGDKIRGDGDGPADDGDGPAGDDASGKEPKTQDDAETQDNTEQDAPTT
ncbi:hypothetical protein LOC61_08425 [Arthrobacter sp. zg-Y820]|uniref:hypothetical protein n=2 Tax=Arthrobacter TaxID=1663 RepID=UPI001E556F72|nr:MULTISPECIES: hypothetical protein [unclassified Arthrobacter]MCC9196884.1 hypothetical protein [Arthrobacter sp. zg-Y820]MDK1279748.1 hypothetical protein [Arthrobacter sp. zg.Y820]